VPSTWSALADPHRRAMVELLLERPRPVGELVDRLGLSQPGTSKHLRVLREAGLVRVRVAGNRRLYRSDQVRLQELREALDAFWGERLGRLRAEVEGGG
jgi:DNA-binding transcriptional ArsR family regulator